MTIQAGGTALIPPSTARISFLGDKDATKSTGWKPSFKAEPFKADGFVEAKAVAFIKPAVGLEISVVETGLSAEIEAKTPALTASLKGIACKFFFFISSFPLLLRVLISLSVACLKPGCSELTDSYSVKLYSMRG